MEREDDFQALEDLVLSNRNARTAAFENDLRRKLAKIIEEEREQRGLSIRGLAKEMGTSISQVQRLLHREVGGTLTLRTLVRAADALGMVPSVNMRPKVTSPATVVPFGTTAWSKLSTSPQGKRISRLGGSSIPPTILE